MPIQNWRKLLAAAAIHTYASMLQAQTVPLGISPLDGTTPGINTPGAPADAYRLSHVDSVNLSNGHLAIAIPLVDIPGRGAAKTGLVLRIESNWRVIDTTVPILPCGQSGCTFATSYVATNTPWYLDEPTIAQGVMQSRSAGSVCQLPGQAGAYWKFTLTRLTYIGPDGTEYEFRDQATGGQPQLGYGGGFNRGQKFVAYDGSGAVFTSSSAIVDNSLACQAFQTGATGIMTLRDGTQYTFTSGYVTLIEDRNGNQVKFLAGGDPLCNANATDCIQDSLGRVTNIAISNGTGSTAQQVITYKGFKGADRTITIKYDSLNNLLVSGQKLLYRNGTPPDSSGNPTSLFPNVELCSAGNCTGSLFSGRSQVSEVDLANGQKYTFKYNNYGDVAEMDLPTGGAYKYTYGSFVAVSGTEPNLQYILQRYVTQKQIFVNASDSAAGQMISYSGYFTGSVQVQYADSSLERHTIIPPSLVPLPESTDYNNWSTGKETATDYYESDGTTLIRHEAFVYQQRDCSMDTTCWFLQPPPSNDQYPAFNTASTVNDVNAPSHDPRLTQKTVTMNSSQTFQDVYLYDQYNNEKERDEYDFGTFGGGVGSLSKVTATTYQQYLPQNILSLPSVTSIFADLAQTQQLAKTTYNYDETTPSTLAGVILHDDTNYGTSFKARGNPTTVQHSVTNSVTNSTSTIASTFTYDVAGNLTSAKDQRGVQLSYSYADSRNSYAFPTSVISYPVLSSTSTRFIANAAYDYDAGRAISTTDLNGNSMAYDYSDSLDRLKMVTRPDTGQTNVVYSDTPGSLSVLVKQDQITSADGVIQNTTNYDGLGRKTQTVQAVPSDYIGANFAYDARGRLSSVSNPYFGSSGPTDYTVTLFDGIGRARTITQPGAAVSTMQYSGNQTLTKDPAGVVKLTTSDRFGRSTSVLENPTGAWNGGPSTPGFSGQSTYTTNYLYDPLDNLAAVDQAGQSGCRIGAVSHSRCFVYDSLRRLVQASNPESGTITYTYDDSGNLAKKTDAASRITCFGTLSGTTCSADGYDGLNRPTLKSYSDGTPSAIYRYDSHLNPVPSGVTSYPKGRLTAVVSGGQQTTYDALDALGRITYSTQVTGGASYAFGSDSAHPGYRYNLAGGLTAIQYPSLRVVNYAFDGAERVNEVTGYAWNIGYASHGAINTLQLGKVKAPVSPAIAEFETTSFNNRLQVTDVRLGTWAGGSDLLSLHNDYGTASANNGNPMGQTIGAPGWSTQQTYTYDAFNRLKTALEGASAWKQTFVYDQYGNRALLAGTYPPAYIPGGNNTPQVTTDDPSQLAGHFPNNQSDVCSQYDAAGNAQTCSWSAAVNYSYGAENRMLTAGNTTFVYDGNGRRVQKATSSGTTTYVYDAMGELAAEYGVAGNGGTQFLTADHLGTTRVVTDGNGGVISRHDYLPFGEEIVDPSIGNRSSVPGYAVTDGITEKFTGKERDAETGLDYFGARYLSSAQGRWMSPDWSATPQAIPFADISNPQTLNLYSYVRNNPLSNADADGHCGLADPMPCLVIPALVATSVKVFGAAAAGTAAAGGAVVAAGGAFIIRTTDAYVANKNDEMALNAEESRTHASNVTNLKRPGTLGKPDHQATVEEERQRIDGTAEVRIDTPGGSRGSRRADAVGTNPGTGLPEIVQVYRPTPGGNLPQRETGAAADIEQATGVKPTMVPVRPVPPPKPPEKPPESQ